MSEQNAIVSTIERYIEGGRLGKSEVMKQAFADNATMYFIVDDKLDGGPIQTLYDAVDNLGPAPNLKSEIGPVDVNKSTATAHVEFFDWAGARYTDQLVLLKTGDDWKIIHKVYHQHS